MRSDPPHDNFYDGLCNSKAGLNSGLTGISKNR